jgi:hypothetical protein
MGAREDGSVRTERNARPSGQQLQFMTSIPHQCLFRACKKRRFRGVCSRPPGMQYRRCTSAIVFLPVMRLAQGIFGRRGMILSYLGPE